MEKLERLTDLEKINYFRKNTKNTGRIEFLNYINYLIDNNQDTFIFILLDYLWETEKEMYFFTYNKLTETYERKFDNDIFSLNLEPTEKFMIKYFIYINNINRLSLQIETEFIAKELLDLIPIKDFFEILTKINGININKRSFISYMNLIKTRIQNSNIEPSFICKQLDKQHKHFAFLYLIMKNSISLKEFKKYIKYYPEIMKNREIVSIISDYSSDEIFSYITNKTEFVIKIENIVKTQISEKLEEN